MVASDILRESGFETFHAYDASDAAQLLDEHPEIEVMVTEARLPGDVSGLELCRRVQQRRPEVQVVIMAVGPGVEPDEIPRGARVLRKPYASGELRTLIAAKSPLADA
jgi:DNA-binding NtrC family response regulator